MKDKIAELVALEAKATPGPWSLGPTIEGIWRDNDYIGHMHWNPVDDASLIVAMRNALPQLLELIKDMLRGLMQVCMERNVALARAEKAEAERDVLIQRISGFCSACPVIDDTETCPLPRAMTANCQQIIGAWATQEAAEREGENHERDV